MYTIEDVGPRVVNGAAVEIPPEERQAICDEWNAEEALRPAREATAARLAALDQAIAGDTTLNELKAMTNQEYNTWWDQNITTAAAAISVLKRLARVIIRRVL